MTKRNLDITCEQLDRLCISIMSFGIIGGRLGYVIIEYISYGSEISFWGMISVWNGGMAFQGGIVGGILGAIGFLVLLDKTKILPNLSDIILPLVPIGIAIGRLGNFMNEEFMNEIPLIRIPSCLFASITEGVLLFIILHVLIKSRKYTKYEPSLFFFFGYGLIRFINDIFREEKQFYFLRFSQYVCITLMIVSSFLLLFIHRSKSAPNTTCNFMENSL